MKTFTLFALLLLAPLARAEDQEHQMCSAELEYLDGTKQTAILECDNPYAGKCWKETRLPGGEFEWLETQCE